MSLFDGETFRGLDEALTARDEPLDTLLEHQVRNQVYHLAIQRGSRVSMSLSTRATTRSTFLGEKAYSSSSWTAVVDVPWYVGSGLSAINAQLWARVSTSRAAPIGSTISVRLEVVDFGYTDHELAYNAGLYQAYPIAHELVTQPRESVLTRLRVWIWSRADDTALETPDADPYVTRLPDGRPSRRMLLVCDPDYMPAPTLPAPNATSRGEARIVWGEGPNVVVQVADILWRERTAFSPFFRELHCAEPPVSASREAAMGYQQLSYIQIKTVEIEEQFLTPDVLPSVSIRAQMPVTGQDAIRHVALARAVFMRPRCLAVGPSARVPRVTSPLGGVIETTIYPERWVWSYDVEPDDPPDQGQIQRVWTQGVTLDDPGGSLMVQALIVPYVYLTTAQWLAIEGQPVAEVSTLATWHIRARLKWWDGSAWLTIDDQTVTQQLAHIPTRINEPHPILTTAWAREQTDSPSGIWHKEGQMYENDLALLEPIAVGLTIPDNLDIASIPLHLEITAQRMTVDDQPVGVAVSGKPQIVWTGISAWQVRS